MISRQTGWVLCGCFLAAAAVPLACGDPPPPKPTPQPTATPAPEPTVEPEETTEGAGGQGGAGGAAAAPETTSKPRSSGRPAVLMGPSKRIENTFGATPATVLKLSAGGGGNIVLKIPEFALNTGYNVLFEVASGGKKKGKAFGSVAHLRITRGTSLLAMKVATRGPDFEVRWPLGGKDTFNLAVAEIDSDKGGNEIGTPKWTIYAPKNVDKGFGEAYFNIPSIGPHNYLHATDEAPSEGAAPEGG